MQEVATRKHYIYRSCAGHGGGKKVVEWRGGTRQGTNSGMDTGGVCCFCLQVIKYTTPFFKC
jgi:hypothetical protein